MNTHEELQFWARGKRLFRRISRILESFPDYEERTLAPIIQKAAHAVPKNICLAFEKHSPGDVKPYFTTALGSLVQLKGHLSIGHDLGYVAKKEYEDLAKEIEIMIDRVVEYLNDPWTKPEMNVEIPLGNETRDYLFGRVSPGSRARKGQ